MSCWWSLPRAGWWCAVWGWETVCWQGTIILAFIFYSQYFITKAIFFLQRGYRIVKQAGKYQRHLRSVPGEASLAEDNSQTLPDSPQQAMISGVKAQNQTLDEIERLEESGMEALRNRCSLMNQQSFLVLTLLFREFTSALETIDQALNHASGCVRLKMARGDCLAHLGR